MKARTRPPDLATFSRDWASPSGTDDQVTLPSAGLLLFGVAILISASLLPFLERIARGTGAVDAPGGRKQHEGPTPLAGGIAVLTAVVVPATVGLLVALRAWHESGWVPDELLVHLPGVRRRAPQLLCILAGTAVMMVLGHIDDRRGLSPWLKLAVQGACAAMLTVAGLHISLYLDSPVWQIGLTILYVVFITNAVNFIDNMNGLMAGVVLIGSLHLLTLAIATGQLFMAAILICLTGGLCGFLPRNFPRARVFMGDSGSLAIGFLLASLTVAFTFDEGPPSTRPFLLPAAILAIPAWDGLLVIVSRARRGVHPFTAGRDHLSHRLVARGLSPVRAVVTLWTIQFLAGVPVVLDGQVPFRVLATVWGIATATAFAVGWRRRIEVPAP